MLDRISKTLDPVGRVEEYTYDPVGNVTEITKNGGRAYTYTYDNVGNLTSAKNPMNQVQNFTYDSMNRLTSETDLAGKATSYTYDLNGQLTSVKDRNNAVTAYTYDANGNVTSITDPESRRISYTYDLLDRIINVTEGETQTAVYEYDSVGNLTKYIDGNGKATAYTYNKLGDMTSITDPLGNVKEFSYNVNAMLETVTNPDGGAVNYDYDVLDELIGKRYDNEEDPQALYGYDLDGNRISMDDVAGTTGYEYDEVGRITAVNLSNGKKIKYSYDEYGNISKLTYPDNTTVQYTYDELDRLTQIKDRQGKITKYERDANGNVTRVTRPNNTYSTIEYDDMGNVIKVTNMGKEPYFGTAKTLSTFAYTYDKSGFITSEAAAVDKQVVTNLYEYDERAQLVKDSQTITVNGTVTESTQTVYTYDNAGNRLTTVKTSDDSVICNIQYTYNDNNQVTDIEGNCDDDNKYKHVVLSYDKNGNLTRTQCNETEKVMDYTYDNENRLKAVKENGTLLMAALYDGNGDRIFRLDYRKNAEYVSNQAGTAENVYYPSSSVNSSYDTDVILNEMLIPNGVTNNTAINYELTGYINDINTEYTQTLMEFGANGSTTNVYEYGDGRNSATINGTKGYYLYDGRGSVSSLTGSSGSNIISYSYDAYGNTTKSNNTLNNPYQYNAEYTDSSTGLQYLRARYYDSSQGRFTTKDTYLGEIEYPLSRNLYTYCYNNPLYYTDPSGHFGILAAVGIGAAVGGVIGAVSNGYSQYKQTGSLKSINWKDVGKSALKGAAVGAVGGLVGGAVAAVATAAVGTAAIGGGVTLTLAQSIGVGAVSSMAGGIASRYVGSRWDGNSVRTSASAAFNPWAIAFDGLLGGAFGGLTHSSQPQYPFGKPPQTKGEYNTAKAWLEKFKKFCDEHGLAKVGKQTVEDPVKVPADDLIEQAKQNLDDGLGIYKDQGGHHPMAKSAFDGVENYDYKSALTISNQKLTEFGVKHSTITGQQNSLYSTFAKTGKQLTMEEMRNIEIQAMVNSGVPKDYATHAVDEAINELIKSGVTNPTRIPWN